QDPHEPGSDTERDWRRIHAALRRNPGLGRRGPRRFDDGFNGLILFVVSTHYFLFIDSYSRQARPTFGLGQHAQNYQPSPAEANNVAQDADPAVTVDGGDTVERVPPWRDDGL